MPWTGERAELETLRRPTGKLAEGRVILARSLPRPGGRYGLLGAPPVVDAEAQGEFEDLVVNLKRGGVDARDLGPEHGAQLLAAAWAWPEEREHTAEGDIVVGQYVDYQLDDPDATLELLLSDPAFEFVRDDGEFSSFSFRPPGWRAPERREPASERGVRWKLCEEDAGERPWLAEVSFDHYEEELTLHTLAEERLPRAETELRKLLGRALGRETQRHSDHPDVLRRWQRERLELRYAPALAAGDEPEAGLARAA